MAIFDQFYSYLQLQKLKYNKQMATGHNESKHLSQTITDHLIEPLQQKIFSFDQHTLMTSEKLSKNVTIPSTQVLKSHWQPVVSYKKVSLDPKFILSMERKKLRIISAIRDQYVQPVRNKHYGMIGGVVRHYRSNSVRVSNNKSTLQSNTSNHSIQKFVQQNERKLNGGFLKEKKNPIMNFSLCYMIERKKQIQNVGRKNKRTESTRPMTVSRGKGSDSPYLHMIMTQFSGNQRRQVRPMTSQTQMLSNRNIPSRCTNMNIKSARFQSQGAL